MFQPGPDKPFVATPAALDLYSRFVIICCLQVLREKAEKHNGLDYLQVFESSAREDLWFIEDDVGGAITALLPSDY